MDKGVLLFAHNGGGVDYLAMAAYAAARINKYLDLPVTLVTDKATLRPLDYKFDSTVIVDMDIPNWRGKNVWHNTGRWRALHLTPYSDTLLLDADYIVNSSRLLECFKLDTDFCCHRSVQWLMAPRSPECLGRTPIETLWATVVRFRKTSRVQHIFDLVEQVQSNYGHYSSIYGFLPYSYRNDYALTIAHKTVCGHVPPEQDYIPWNLVHISPDVTVTRLGDSEYKLTRADKKTGRAGYIIVKDFDFHMLDKSNYLEVCSE